MFFISLYYKSKFFANYTNIEFVRNKTKQLLFIPFIKIPKKTILSYSLDVFVILSKYLKLIISMSNTETYRTRNGFILKIAEKIFCHISFFTHTIANINYC